MARERWFADGLEITKGYVRDVESYEGLYGNAPITATDISIPMRDGEMPVPARFGPSSFVLRIWLAGGTRSELMLQWEQILRVLAKRHRLVTWTQHRADGTVRVTEGRIIGKVDPTPIGGLGMRAQIEVTVPSGVWNNTADVNTGAISLATSGELDRLVDLPGFAGASAPMTKLIYVVTGPIVTPRIRCPETGAWAAYDGTIGDGQQWYIDAGRDFVNAPQIDLFRYLGPYMMEVLPKDDIALRPQLRVQATQAGTGATIRVIGRRAYLF